MIDETLLMNYSNKIKLQKVILYITAGLSIIAAIVALFVIFVL